MECVNPEHEQPPGIEHSLPKMELLGLPWLITVNSKG